MPDLSECGPGGVFPDGTIVADCDQCIPEGTDCWNTPCGDTHFNFCDNPLPADFFGPGSEPFEGTVRLQGATGFTDTLMIRTDRLILDNIGDCGVTPILLEGLALIDCAPITVVINGVDTPWNVEVSLGVGANNGMMTICRTHPGGGTFTSDFLLQPKFTFTLVDPPNTQIELDTALFGIPPTEFRTVVPASWVYDAPAGACTQNFVPGVDGASGAGCTSGLDCCRPVGHEGPGHIHETEPPVCVPCQCGACCLGGGACTVVIEDVGAGQTAEDVCVGMGGVYMGAGTGCDDADADGLPDVFETGICCDPNRDDCHTGTSPFSDDTDGDARLDGDELAKGFDPCVSDGAIPVASTWGVIMLALILFTAGSIVFGSAFWRRHWCGGTA